MTESLLGGSDGRTICMEETGTKLPLVAGIGFRLPPLPVPGEGSCPKSESSKSFGADRTPWILIFGGGTGLFVRRAGNASQASAATMTACVRIDALCARLVRGDFSHRNECRGAPFAEEGKMRVGSRSWRKFPRMRQNQESLDAGEIKKFRENKSRKGRPPRAPPWVHPDLKETCGERRMRSPLFQIGCLKNRK
jgi:hypothetical protein